MATKFPDFHKETKDLLGKYVAEGKADKDGAVPLVFKMESKLKLGKGVKHVVNPTADKNGVSMKAECDWDCCLPGVKSNVTLKEGLKGMKPTVSYECCGHKVEASVAGLCGDEKKAYEVAVEEKQKTHAVNAKLTPADVAVDAAAPVPGVDKLTVGFQLTVPLKDAVKEEVDAEGNKKTAVTAKKFALSNWAAGVRYQCCKDCVCNVTTKALKSFQFGCCSAIPGVELSGKPVTTAAQIDYDMAKKTFLATVGATGKTPLCPLGSNFKVKVDSKLNVAVTLLLDLAGWKVAMTCNPRKCGLGMTATRE